MYAFLPFCIIGKTNNEQETEQSKPVCYSAVHASLQRLLCAYADLCAGIERRLLSSNLIDAATLLSGSVKSAHDTETKSVRAKSLILLACMLQLFGYFGVLISGVLLGLLGGGGAIIIVPIMVYLFGIAPVTATGYTFFVIAFTSLVGFYRYNKQGLASVKTALIFGLPSLITVFLSRRILLPALPDVFFQAGTFQFTKDMGVMVLFAVLMLATSYNILFGKKPVAQAGGDAHKDYGRLIVRGLLVGMITGFVGGGGGFLIVSALVLLLGMTVKSAVGTSMLIISINSAIGFIGHLSLGKQIDWKFISIFTAIAIGGIVIGNILSGKISETKLRTVFGWFLIVMATSILGMEIYRGM
ncbi:MAG: sulfite exporter TauE/SafE family protein [Chitinophagales bacterium]|nr:sulfite exporter TauE/SafE family protein [Chitinophagales bacterium]